MNYELYHTHPINKLLHFICIPAIIISSSNLLSIVKVKIYKTTFDSQELLMLMMLYNYYNISKRAFLVMFLYFLLTYSVALYMRIRNNYMYTSLCIFVCAWVLQFIGHAIEGRKPALMDGIFQAFNEAPLFSISYILPFKVV